MSHYVTIRFDFSDTSKYASIPLYIGFPATFIPFFIYIQSELSPLRFDGFDVNQDVNGGQRKPVNRMTETIKYCVTNQKHLVMVNILSCYVSVKTENGSTKVLAYP